jgi:hypothetical protein
MAVEQLYSKTTIQVVSLMRNFSDLQDFVTRFNKTI